MRFHTNLSKNGNSLYALIPFRVLEKLGLKDKQGILISILPDTHLLHNTLFEMQLKAIPVTLRFHDEREDLSGEIIGLKKESVVIMSDDTAWKLDLGSIKSVEEAK